MLLEGIFIPLTTPFHPDGRLFFSKLQTNVDRYSRTPVAGFHLLGANGEAAGLTDHEACDVLGEAIAAAAPEKVMLAGVGRESVFATLALAEAAAAVHYDAVTVAPPSFAAEPALRREVLLYFQTVADHSPLPVVLVSEGSRSLAEDVIAELAQHPNVLGLLDSAARVERVLGATAGVSREVEVTQIFGAVTSRMRSREQSAGLVSAASLTGAPILPSGPVLKTRKKRVGFQVLTSETAGMLAAWQAGAVGAVPRLGAAAPQACYEPFQAWKDQDLPLAEEKQARIQAAAALVEGARGAAWVKYGCDLNAYFGGRPRLPLLPLDGDERKRLETELVTLHN